MIVLPHPLLRPFRCQDRPKRHYNVFFAWALHARENQFRHEA
jgi:hypothetical protein